MEEIILLQEDKSKANMETNIVLPRALIITPPSCYFLKLDLLFD
ncbi:hypothetical protein AB4Y30_00255 [Ornithinibacillus sp. 4-3]|uniref:Uncharacterized protein n=1 Tax=Ornithinibacillus sp. 4-3 TaxID=3231488 RepID=A0AB39HL48_9BACI